jgi:integrase
VGVSPQSISRAAAEGKRLTNASVKRDENGTPSIVLAIGCYEWISNKNHRKYREPVENINPNEVDPDEIREPSRSLKIQRHFDALASMTNFQEEAGELVPKDALFLSQLVTLTDGVVLSDMATCQYYQALRISEIAALDWSNVDFNWQIRKNRD